MRAHVGKRQNDGLGRVGVVVGEDVKGEGFVRVVARFEGNVFRRESVILAAALLGASPGRNPYGNVIARRLGDADRDRDRLAAGVGLRHPVRRGAREEDGQIVVPQGHRVFAVGNLPALRQVAAQERQNNALAPLSSLVVDALQRHGRARGVRRYRQASRGNRVVPVPSLRCRPARRNVQRNRHGRGPVNVDGHLDPRLVVLVKLRYRVRGKCNLVAVPLNGHPRRAAAPQQARILFGNFNQEVDELGYLPLDGHENLRIDVKACHARGNRNHARLQTVVRAGHRIACRRRLLSRLLVAFVDPVSVGEILSQSRR